MFHSIRHYLRMIFYLFVIIIALLKLMSNGRVTNEQMRAKKNEYTSSISNNINNGDDSIYSNKLNHFDVCRTDCLADGIQKFCISIWNLQIHFIIMWCDRDCIFSLNFKYEHISTSFRRTIFTKLFSMVRLDG